MSSTKQLIVDNALLLLRQKGYFGWSYEHIAKQVNIRKASIHYHFPTKEDLVDEALRQYIDGFFILLEDRTKHCLNSIERLKELFSIVKTTCDSKSEVCLCTMMTTDFFTLSDRIKKRLDNYFSRLREWISLQLTEPGDISRKAAAEKADLIINTLQGLMVTSKIINNSNQFNNCMNLLLN